MPLVLALESLRLQYCKGSNRRVISNGIEPDTLAAFHKKCLVSLEGYCSSWKEMRPYLKTLYRPCTRPYKRSKFELLSSNSLNLEKNIYFIRL